MDRATVDHLLTTTRTVRNYLRPTLSYPAQFGLNGDCSSPACPLRERSHQQCPARTGAP